MLSKWYELKSRAVDMRKKGVSIRDIEKILQIPRSTLSGWFKNIRLTNKQKAKLNRDWLNALNLAREKAVIWHNTQKLLRIKTAQAKANNILGKIDLNDKNVLELALSMLYLGEGSKTQTTSLANSNPIIIKFFIKSLEKLFNINKEVFKYELHLRSNQDEKKAIDYWSKELKVKNSQLSYTKDKRIAKTATYPEYMGVCVVNCGKICIQRTLVHLGQEYCKIQIKDS